MRFVSEKSTRRGDGTRQVLITIRSLSGFARTLSWLSIGTVLLHLVVAMFFFPQLPFKTARLVTGGLVIVELCLAGIACLLAAYILAIGIRSSGDAGPPKTKDVLYTLMRGMIVLLFVLAGIQAA
jgi:hypothetical protein